MRQIKKLKQKSIDYSLFLAYRHQTKLIYFLILSILLFILVIIVIIILIYSIYEINTDLNVVVNHLEQFQNSQNEFQSNLLKKINFK